MTLKEYLSEDIKDLKRWKTYKKSDGLVDPGNVETWKWPELKKYINQINQMCKIIEEIKNDDNYFGKEEQEIYDKLHKIQKEINRDNLEATIKSQHTMNVYEKNKKYRDRINRRYDRLERKI